MEYSQIAGDTGWAAIGIEFEQSAGGCRRPGEEVETEGHWSKVGTDVDILTTPKH